MRRFTNNSNRRVYILTQVKKIMVMLTCVSRAQINKLKIELK